MKKPYSIRTIILAGSLLLQLNTLCFHSRGAAGDVDLSFNPSLSANVFEVTVAVQPDGKVLVGGQFTAVNGTNRNNIARLNANGSLDSSFNPGTGANASVRSVVVQSDGKVLIGGSFTTVNGTNRNCLARLNANGSLDSSFNPELPLGVVVSEYDSAGVAAVAVQPDGKVLVGGVSFHFYGCEYEGCSSMVTINFLVRLNADGSRDTNFNIFNPGPGAYQNVTGIGLQPDGKVLVGEYFGMPRLNANGSLDGSFDPTKDGPVYFVVLQPDGKVLIGGGFTAVNGTNRNGVARLNVNGSLDNSFNPGTGALGVSSVALQPDGKVLIGGGFLVVNGTNRNRIARLNADGTLDSSFNPGTGADGSVHSIALQSDGNVLISGDFTTVNGVVRPYVARLYGDSVAPSLTLARSNGFVIVSWPFPSTGFVLQQNTDLNPAHWTTPSETVTDTGTIRFISVSPALGNHFYRLSKP